METLNGNLYGSVSGKHGYWKPFDQIAGFNSMPKIRLYPGNKR